MIYVKPSKCENLLFPKSSFVLISNGNGSSLKGELETVNFSLLEFLRMQRNRNLESEVSINFDIDGTSNVSQSPSLVEVEVEFSRIREKKILDFF